MKISIFGMGYVGLSNAILLAQNNEVSAIDIDLKKIHLINNKKSPIKDKEIEDYFKNLESLFKKTLVVILLVLYSSFFTPKVFNENDKKYFKSYNLNYLKINYSKILETITH